MKPFPRIPQVSRAAMITAVLATSFAVSAAGPWQLLGTSDKGMELVNSYPSEGECKQAMAAALLRQGQRDFMCVIAGTASIPKK